MVAQSLIIKAYLLFDFELGIKAEEADHKMYAAFCVAKVILHINCLYLKKRERKRRVSLPFKKVA